MMTDESGQYDARKIRKNGGIWLPAGILAAVVTGAIAWGTNVNRLQNVEQQAIDGKAERDRIEIHLSADDQQIAILKERLQFIVEQVQLANAKLDRAEEERRK